MSDGFSVDSINLYSDLSNAFSMLKLMELFLKACSSAAMFILSVSFLRNPFLNHLQDFSVVISTFCQIDSRSLFFLSLILLFLLSISHYFFNFCNHYYYYYYYYYYYVC